MKALILHAAMTGYRTKNVDGEAEITVKIGGTNEYQQSQVSFLPEPLKSAEWPRDSLPKALYEMSGQVILERMVKMLKAVGISKIRLVAGWKKKTLDEFNESRSLGLDIVYNPRWMEYYNSIETLYVGLKDFGEDDDLLVVMGDVYITFKVLQQVIRSKKDYAMSSGHVWMIRKGHLYVIDQMKNLEGVDCVDIKLSIVLNNVGAELTDGLGDLDFYHQTDEYKSKLLDYIDAGSVSEEQTRFLLSFYYVNRKKRVKPICDLQAVILMAGVGERMGETLEGSHKSLLKTLGKPLIFHMLDSLAETRIKTVTLVVGFLKNKFRFLVGDKYKGLTINYVENPFYSITGGAHSLFAARHVLENHSCLIVDGDQYLHPSLIHRIVNSPHENCCLIDGDMSKVKFEEEMLAYGSEETVKKLIWKPTYEDDSLGEALGIFKFSSGVSHILSWVLNQYLSGNGKAKREYVESINWILKDYTVHYLKTEGAKWVDIDFKEDYEYAKSLEAQKQK